jgi:hypothetical protein
VVGTRRALDVFLIANARSFAGQIAQVEEARTAYDAFADDLYFLDSRRVRKKNTLDSHVEADLADRKRASSPSPMPFDDHSLKYLRAFFVAFDDAVVNPQTVADAKVGQIGPEKCGLQLGELR